jgi:hypothetical protein
MGTWGEKPFQNDSALDWLAELEAGRVTALRALLSTVADTPADDYLDVDDGSPAIAAAEIVAAALGRGRDRVPKRVLPVVDVISTAVGADDALLAKRAVERVLAKSSELRSLWGEDSEWYANVRVLVARLEPEP